LSRRYLETLTLVMLENNLRNMADFQRGSTMREAEREDSSGEVLSRV
jgi:hypothetical protein